jgi:hypothetical protein
VFFNTVEAPVRCALEISKALLGHSELKVRMGVHSGPINRIRDVDDRPDVAGAEINMAQHVMDCGDAGHILLSKRVADNLEEYPRWRPYLPELGEGMTYASSSALALVARCNFAVVYGWTGQNNLVLSELTRLIYLWSD